MQLISDWFELGIWDRSRSVSRVHVFLSQWIVNGDNGADGHLVRRHVEGELRFQQGGLKNKRRMEEESVWETHSEIGIVTQVLAQV